MFFMFLFTQIWFAQTSILQVCTWFPCHRQSYDFHFLKFMDLVEGLHVHSSCAEMIHGTTKQIISTLSKGESTSIIKSYQIIEVEWFRLQKPPSQTMPPIITSCGRNIEHFFGEPQKKARPYKLCHFAPLAPPPLKGERRRGKKMAELGSLAGQVLHSKERTLGFGHGLCAHEHPWRRRTTEGRAVWAVWGLGVSRESGARESGGVDVLKSDVSKETKHTPNSMFWWETMTCWLSMQNS